MDTAKEYTEVTGLRRTRTWDSRCPVSLGNFACGVFICGCDWKEPSVDSIVMDPSWHAASRAPFTTSRRARLLPLPPPRSRPSAVGHRQLPTQRQSSAPTAKQVPHTSAATAVGSSSRVCSATPPPAKTTARCPAAAATGSVPAPATSAAACLRHFRRLHRPRLPRCWATSAFTSLASPHAQPMRPPLAQLNLRSYLDRPLTSAACASFPLATSAQQLP
jgi:hypothetical protein